MNPPSGKNKRRSWFDRRSDHFIRQVVDDFFLLIVSFQELYGMYLQCKSRQDSCADLLSSETGQIRSRMWNRLTSMIGTESEKGLLWRLKDLCHLVWPEDTRKDETNGALIDWLVGSVFHETMKLKENIYLLNTYGPTAVRMREFSPSTSVKVLRPSGHFPQFSNMVDVDSLIGRIAADVVNQMEQIGFLLGQTNFILRMMMPEMRSNLLVIRLLVEEEALVGKLWGERIEELFAELFSGDVAEGFCAAGRSYLSGQWYGQALAMYERAFDCDGQCDEARTRIAHLKAVLKENTELRDWGNTKGDVAGRTETGDI